MNLPLAALVFRRSLPTAFVLGAVALAIVVVTTQPAPEPAGSGAVARQSVWTVLLACGAPFLIQRAAAIVGRWRTGEIEWLAAAPLSRLGIVTSAWLGAVAAAVSVTVAVGFASELAAPAAPAAERRVGTSVTPTAAILDGERTVEWTLAAPSRASRARLYLAYVPTLSTAEVELVVRALDAGTYRSTRKRVSSRTTLDIELPASARPLQFELRRIGAGGIVLLDRQRVDWLASTASARWASLSLALWVAAALAAWLAVALGLGAWLSSGIATASTLALVLPGWILENDGLRALWPAASLAEALDLTGRGVVPNAPDAAGLAGALTCVVLGLTLAVIGTRRWRPPS